MMREGDAGLEALVAAPHWEGHLVRQANPPTVLRPTDVMPDALIRDYMASLLAEAEHSALVKAGVHEHDGQILED